MIKYVAVLFAIFCLVQSQRPPYAGSPNRYPQVLPQYLDERTTTVAESLANRLGENDSTSVTTTAMPTSTIPIDLPVDAMGDIDLINRIKTWPKEKQPFWFLNWQAIQEHRGDTRHKPQAAQVEPQARSYFRGY
ncbi:uncharacterized protein LOC128887952 [Hylaeus anthracinus]|uniref:uncharacterized protein LOC128887952 n=1 Tax=Hylaeus anthracinus TaxID=313031 RepID=UPI0023B914AB|nr:uncharacterized protein LOC128887952 [Hylaeus anthracinus]